jgi:hypothetical protein
MRLRAATLALSALLIGGAGAWTPFAPSPARAQSAEPQPADALVEDVEVRVGPVWFRAKRIEFRGANLPAADLRGLFDTASGESLGGRIAKLTAAEIVIPELVSEASGPGGTQITTYRDVRLRQVRAGQVASMAAAAGVIMAKGSGGSSSGEFARVAIEEVDLGHIAAVFAGRPGPAEMKRVYGAVRVEELKLTDPKGATSRIAGMTARDLKAKPLPAGLAGAMTALAAGSDPKAASPAERRRVFGITADLLESLEIGSFEATGMMVETPADGGSGRIARLAYTGGTKPELRVEGFDAGGADSRVRIASLALGGYSLAPMLTALRDLGASADEEIGPDRLRALIPATGSLRVSDVQISAARQTPGQRPLGPIGVTIGSIETSAEKPVSGLPTEIRLAFRDVAFPLPQNPEDEALKQLARLGYERVEGSIAGELAWTESSSEVALRDLSVRGAEMGSVAVRGVLGNVSRDAFSPDSAVAAVAWVGASLRSLDVTIENGGLAERLLRLNARDQGRTPDDLRREYGLAAALGIPAMLGASPASRTLAQAVSRFVAKPGRLTVNVRAKAAAGLGVADMLAVPDPTAILDQVEISARAE